MNQVNKVLAFAERYIGYLEKQSGSQLDSMTANAGDRNYTIFAEWYRALTGENYQAQPWCAMFVSTCFTKALGDAEGKKLVKPFAYCPTGVNWFRAQGRWHTSNPQAGDIIFFKDSQGVACHVGLVSSASASMVVTIEGNTSGGSTVIANGGGVCKKSYPLTYGRIMGYGRPDYQNIKEDEGVTVEAFKKLYDEVNPLYTKIADVPTWYRAEAKELKDAGVLKGDGKHEISIRLEGLQGAVIALRAVKASK